MRRWRSRLAAACLVCALGCKAESRRVMLAIPEVTITVDDPGAEPRVPYRWRSPAHATFRATYTVDYAVGGVAVPGRTSVSTKTGEADVDADGIEHDVYTTIESKVTNHPSSTPRKPPGEPQTLGRVTESWIDARGAHVRPSVSIRNADDLSADDTRLAEFMTVAPEPPLGVGAKWTEHVTVAGHTATTHHELLARDGHRVHIRIAFESTREMWEVPVDETGTIDYDFDETGAPPYTMHETTTLTIHRPKGGDATGNETYDDVLVPAE